MTGTRSRGKAGGEPVSDCQPWQPDPGRLTHRQAWAKAAPGQDSCSLTFPSRFSQATPTSKLPPSVPWLCSPPAVQEEAPRPGRGSQALQADGGCSWRTLQWGPLAGCRQLEGLRPWPDSGEGLVPLRPSAEPPAEASSPDRAHLLDNKMAIRVGSTSLLAPSSQQGSQASCALG